ncbi:Hsp70 family protein [Agromyces laixinhei]|uniref:Hsp70 family protein n=1 Tax=Agromyces laixinhei TaxID=2585717 RepID=UPI0012EE4F80|nr:Hsp70 family protein [Agromyces laixinhei]
MEDTSYVLAVDIGTSRVAAATARVERDGSFSATPFALGRNGDCVATVVFVSDDGDLLFGDAAERRGVAQPERLVREFKRSIGDDVPLVVGGRSLAPELLYAETFASVVAAVTERMGSRPESISLTHPTAWGAHRLGLIRAALARLGVDDVSMITEPEAAARQYEATRPLEPGQSIAVYDLGGGTFDSVVLRKGADSEFTLVGDPAGLDDLGGANFDDDVFRHVISVSGLDVSALSVDDPDTRMALSRLRRESIDAKEALSFDSDATIPVLMPQSRSTVRLTRSEFEHMIDGALDTTLGVLETAIDSADLIADQLEAILLIGGSSRIPLVAQRLSERFDRPLAVDADPKASIALGAARTVLGQQAQRNAAAAALVPVAFEVAADDADVETAAEVAEGRGLVLARITGAFALARPAPNGPASTRARRGSPWLLAGAVALISGAIIFGGTMAAGTRMYDYDTAASSDGDNASDPTVASLPAGPAAKAFVPFAQVYPVVSPVVDPGVFRRADDSGDAKPPSARPSPSDERSPAPRAAGPRNAPPAATPPSGQADNTPLPPEDTVLPPEPTTQPTTPPATEPPTPAPTTETPAPEPPAPAPTTETPAPEPPAPAPTTETPAPEPEPPAPSTETPASAPATTTETA